MSQYERRNPKIEKPKPVKKAKPRGGKTAWIFRLQSSRGTDIITCVLLPPGTTEKNVKQYADDWADRHMRGSPIESATISYHHISRLQVADRDGLLKKWKKVCEQYRAAKYARDVVQAMLSPTDWSNQ